MNFTPNTPTIAIEDFDNEIIIVNLEKGNYYSLRHSAFDAWNLFASGYTLQDSVNTIAENYSLKPEDVTTTIESFLSQLTNESLLVPVQTQDTDPVSYTFTQKDFQPPLLEVFTDMQELLLLDPIHEVKPQEQGWPFKK
jgi:hypothetical protein